MGIFLFCSEPADLLRRYESRTVPETTELIHLMRTVYSNLFPISSTVLSLSTLITEESDEDVFFSFPTIGNEANKMLRQKESLQLSDRGINESEAVSERDNSGFVSSTFPFLSSFLVLGLVVSRHSITVKPITPHNSHNGSVLLWLWPSMDNTRTLNGIQPSVIFLLYLYFVFCDVCSF